MKPVEAETSDDVLAQFCAEHGQPLLRFAYLLTGGRAADAEDLVQSALAGLAARGLSGLDSPAAYVRRSIINEHRSAGRHATVERRVHPRLVEPSPPVPTPEDRFAVLSALDTLTERERAAVVLRYYEDLPDEQIAATLGCRRATVRSLIHRAMPKLRRLLDDGDGRSERSPDDDAV